jgi:UDPglucose--hexose-1-phosphate uridylyltransferase
MTSTDRQKRNGGLTPTVTCIADRRELITLEETADDETVLADPRDLPPIILASMVRQDPLLGQWVGSTGKRRTRMCHRAGKGCPHCPSTPDNHSGIPMVTWIVLPTGGARRADPE